ncbi:small GTP-binding protein [Histomonas meleagridis]|uniref:small GTP-binding protein n=1 Tax=Histomonas meleagridis TaxID=135588 RepID=UPI003559CEF8|nr:small GTP-binding protein [Histomonas meleagridis]KAH0802858.1 small GTP-binding protein [Histomonas meleagridis]
MIEEQPKYKVILLGDTGVGKTSIVRCQSTGKFDFKMAPTVGASHIKTTIPIGDKKVDLLLWDTAGQEQFSSLVPMYSRGAHACILVASIVNPDSCDHLLTWLERLNSTNAKIPVVVAINKSDLSEGAPITFDEVKEKYSQWLPVFFFVSAKTGDCIPQLFQQVAFDAMNNEQQKTTPPPLEENDQKDSRCC